MHIEYHLLLWGAVAIMLMPSIVRAESDKSFVHVTRAVTTCVIAHTTTNPRIRDGKTQYNIAYEWTYEHGVQKWSMTPWTRVSDFDSHAEAAVLQGAPPPGPAGIQHTVISYTTKLHLPSILASIINTNQIIHVKKYMYTVGSHIYTFVEIVDVPFVDSIRIDSVMQFFGNSRVISKHNVEYKSFPWLLGWAAPVLKREIIKSLDRIDMLSAQKYCKT